MKVLALVGIAIACVTASLSAVAQPDMADPEKSKGKEAAVPVPQFPNKENLARINLGLARSFELFVDLESISVTGDGIIYYTLVAQSESGAQNVSFEAIRCKTKEHKVLALGRSDRTWAKPRNSEWREFSATQGNQVPIVLARYYFCPMQLAVTSRQEAVSAIRSGGHPSAK